MSHSRPCKLGRRTTGVTTNPPDIQDPQTRKTRAPAGSRLVGSNNINSRPKGVKVFKSYAQIYTETSFTLSPRQEPTLTMQDPAVQALIAALDKVQINRTKK
jgi:hypothetical protein